MSFADGGRPRHQIVRSHEVQELARPVRVAAERDADAGAAFRGARALLEWMRRAGLRLVVASSTRAEELGQLLRIAGTDGLIKTTTSSRRRGPVEARPRRRRRRAREGRLRPAGARSSAATRRTGAKGRAAPACRLSRSDAAR